MGKKWAIYRVLDEENRDILDGYSRGICDPERSRIAFRARDRDTELLTIIHEVIHPSCPKLKDADVEIAAIAIKTAMEAFGVDLSPMLRGYK